MDITGDSDEYLDVSQFLKIQLKVFRSLPIVKTEKKTVPKKRYLSVLLVKSNKKYYSGKKVHRMFSRFGTILRITYAKYNADHRFAIYYDKPFGAEIALYKINCCGLLLHQVKYYVLHNLTAQPDLEQRVNEKLGGMVVDIFEYHRIL